MADETIRGMGDELARAEEGPRYRAVVSDYPSGRQRVEIMDQWGRPIAHFHSRGRVNGRAYTLPASTLADAFATMANNLPALLDICERMGPAIDGVLDTLAHEIGGLTRDGEILADLLEEMQARVAAVRESHLLETVRKED